jgi:alpha-1,3-fucosyltransferase
VTSLYCPFLSNRCTIITDHDRFSEADAIVYHMRDGVDQKNAREKRHPKQRIVFALWESPAHTPDLQSYRQFFNWTMTYRLKSDVITSYYSGNAYVHTSSDYYRLMIHENSTRKLNLKIRSCDHRPSDEILQKKKLGIAAALISNCGGSSKRLEFIKKLKPHLDVKVYGRCGEACPAKMNCREFIAQNYYFIFSFENSLCTEYTSKFKEIIENQLIGFF